MEPAKTAIVTREKAIVMKSGAVHWVSIETAEKVESHLKDQTAHSFIRLKDYDMTFNTAEIEGVYTPEQYDSIQKVKQGYWQCEHKNWHQKKDRCECAAEKARREKMRRQAQEMSEMGRELTEDEKRANRNKLRIMKEEMAIKGSLFADSEVRESTIKAWEEKNGPIPEDRRKKIKIIKG